MVPPWTEAFSGDGDGYGDGSGYGSGSGYWASLAAPLIDWASDAFYALWKSDKRGMPANGGRSAEAARPGLMEEVKGPLALCGSKALHATLNPDKRKGDRVWVVALSGPIAIAEDKGRRTQARDYWRDRTEVMW